MTTKITNTILMAQNRMLRDQIGILNETVAVLESFISAMRRGEPIPTIPFPQESPVDGTPWNANDYEIDGDTDPDRYDIGGDEYRDPRSGADTWSN